MKRLSSILTIFMVLLSITVFAQQEQKSSTETTEEAKVDTVEHVKKNELKLNLFSAVMSTIDITYERALTDDSGLGLSSAYCFYSKDYHGFTSEYLWSFTPYYRLYFGKKPNSGFFTEINATATQTRNVTGFSYYDNTTNNFIDNTYYHDKFAVGAGFAVGGKFLTKKGLIGEVFGGMGRYISKVQEHGDVTYPRFGVLIGKRF